MQRRAFDAETQEAIRAEHRTRLDNSKRMADKMAKRFMNAGKTRHKLAKQRSLLV